MRPHDGAEFYTAPYQNGKWMTSMNDNKNMTWGEKPNSSGASGMVVTFSWFIFTVCCSLICITQSYIVHKPWRRRTNLFSSSSSLKPLLSDIPNSPPSFLLDGDFLNALPKTTAQHPRCAVYPTIDARYVDGCIPADLCDKIIEVVETGAAFQVRHSEERGARSEAYCNKVLTQK